jgi:hypothetical protein
MGDAGGLPMGSLVELFCACGASQHVPADRVEAGRLPPCRDCGGTLRADSPLPAEASLPDSAAPLAPLASGAAASRGPDGGELRCPACGGPCKAVLRGREGSDRMLACGFCGTKVDLPEARGFTRERVTERPDERIVERLTQWESMGGEAADPGASWPADGRGSPGASIAVAETFEVNGRRFDSREALEEHLRDILPEGAVADVLSRISGAQGGDRSVWTRVQEIESTTLLGGGRRAGRRARSRPTFGGLLARIRKLFG